MNQSECTELPTGCTVPQNYITRRMSISHHTRVTLQVHKHMSNSHQGSD